MKHFLIVLAFLSWSVSAHAQVLVWGSAPSSVILANGSAAAPSFTFLGDTTTGFYRSGVANFFMDWSINGVQFATFRSNRMVFPQRVGIAWSNDTNDPTQTELVNFGADDDKQYVEWFGGDSLTPNYRFYTRANSLAGSSDSGNYEALELRGGTGIINFFAASAGSYSANLNIAFTPKGSGAFQITGPLQTKTLYSAAGTPVPTCNGTNEGMRVSVIDATAPTFLTAYTSGGAVHETVYCDGTSWKNE